MDAADKVVEENEDGDFVARLFNKMSTKTVTVELTRNPCKITETTAIMDRLKSKWGYSAPLQYINVDTSLGLYL